MRAGFLLPLALAAGLAAGCGGDGSGDAGAEREAGAEARVRRVLDRARTQVALHADSMDAALQPLPLLTGAQEGALRRYLNADHLARARALGVPRPRDTAELEELRRTGRLVPLADSTRLWIVRELDYSVPLVTPDAHALLTEIGERFQARLDSLGLPPLRLEVTSALRTADTQAELRRVNPNAAAGVSTHEFGTTLDIAYNSFAAPEDPAVDAGDVPWLRDHLHLLSVAVTEAVAARRSRELQAILGRVLQELQAEGKVMVTLERRQPVYHITVARTLAEDASR